MPRVDRPPAPPVSLQASIATGRSPWQNEKDAISIARHSWGLSLITLRSNC